MMPLDIHHRLLLLGAALAVDALFGDMRFLFHFVPHPVALAGRAIAVFERKLNRARRSAAARRVRGAVTVLALVAGAALTGFLLHLVANRGLAGAAIEVFAVAVLLAWRSLHDHVLAVAWALARGGVQGGRQAVSHIVGRDPMSLDAPGIARAAIESLAENFSDGVIAPAFWYLLLGLPGLLAYKMANTLDSMIGHKNDRYRDFGWAAARFDDLVNLVPARLSGCLLAFAALFEPGASAGHAFRIMVRDAGKHHSPNAGWPEAAVAGALGLALAGPRFYRDGMINDPWLGDGTARATPDHIARALTLYRLAGGILVGLVFGAWLAGHFSLLG